MLETILIIIILLNATILGSIVVSYFKDVRNNTVNGYAVLNRSHFAKSLFVETMKNQPYALERMYGDIDIKDGHEYKINDILKVKVKYIFNYKETVTMRFETYLENVLMASYCAKIYRGCQDWITENDFTFHGYNDVEIIHIMPNQSIHLMNDWSRSKLGPFFHKRKQEQDMKKQKEREQHEKEESIIKKYR